MKRQRRQHDPKPELTERRRHNPRRFIETGGILERKLGQIEDVNDP